MKSCPPLGQAYHFRAPVHGSDMWNGRGGEGFINNFQGLSVAVPGQEVDPAGT